MAPKISVVIPTYNSVGTLKSCIESVYTQTLKPHEVIIVDNNSTDGTWSLLNKYFPTAKKVRLKKNTGVTGGRNTGIQSLSKDFDMVFFFDHDMVADKKMLERSWEVLDKNPDVGIVTPKIYYWEDKTNIWSAGTGINLWSGQVLFRGGIDTGQYQTIEEVQVAPAAMLVRKEVINKIKKFDNRYFATYEDTDFCFRAKKMGFKTYYTPEAISYHKIPLNKEMESIRLISRLYWIGRNRVIFMRDFGKSFIVFLFFIPVFSLYYLILCIKNNSLGKWWSFMKGTFDGLAL